MGAWPGLNLVPHGDRRKYGPQFIDLGIAIGEELYRVIWPSSPPRPTAPTASTFVFDSPPAVLLYSGSVAR
jgi:hypothetical protein